MAESRQAIKNRIRSVESTQKITRVMQLIASTELTKQRKQMEQNRAYAQALEELLAFAVSSSEASSPYLQANEGKPNLYVIFTSDMGLCGSYNANLFRTMTQTMQAKDHLIIVGSKGAAWVKSRSFAQVDCLEELNQDSAYDALSQAMNQAIQLFEDGEIQKIQVLYTHFKNTLTYIPTVETILPVSKEEAVSGHTAGRQVTDFEPSKEEMLEQMIPMAVKSIVYSRYLESKTSEQASRRMAMEAATDNADELRDELMLAYNQARQSAITNEIIDIVGGANALS